MTEVLERPSPYQAREQERPERQTEPRVGHERRRRDEVDLEPRNTPDRDGVEERREEERDDGRGERRRVRVQHRDHDGHKREHRRDDRGERRALAKGSHDKHGPACEREAGEQVDGDHEPDARPAEDFDLPDDGDDDPCGEVGERQAEVPRAVTMLDCGRGS